MQLASELERKREHIQSGLADPHEQGKLRLLSDHLSEFKQFLADKSNSAKHVSQTCKRIERIIGGCEFVTWSEINPSRVVNWLALEREAGQFGIKTSNYYQAAIKEFCTWLVKDGRVPASPVDHLSAINSDSDVRWQRRALTTEQFAMLVDSATNGPLIQCMTGPDRAMLYVLAAWTGYRRGELASLTLRSFNLDDSPPTVTCKASFSKRRRNDIIPLHDVVVVRLREWLARKVDRRSDDPIFDLKTKSGGLRRTAKMMRLDLERVGIPYCDEEGMYADFHANRHTFISNLAKAGVTPKLAQSMARHSDINLTMGVYSHVQVQEQAVAANALPAPPELSRKTVRNSLDNNLDNTTPETKPDESVVHMVVQTPGLDSQSGSSSDSARHGTKAREEAETPCQKPLPEQALVNLCRHLTQGDSSSGGGIRTPDTRIMIPLL